MTTENTQIAATDVWHKTACNLCYANCGIQLRVDETGRTITKVKGDKAHPVSQGYTCNKAARIDFYQNGRDRLETPLRKRPDGSFEAIDWDTAITEIAARFQEIKAQYGGESIMYYGGGGQGNHLGGAYSHGVQKALGMKYKSNAIAQEKTGLAWLNKRMLGGGWHGDFHHCDVAVIIGKNPWQSNGMQKARILMRDLSKSPDRTLIVLDPRRSETAEMADIHLALKPGTDTWCLSAILGYMLQNDLLDLDYIKQHTEGYERVLQQLQEVDVEAYAEFAGIPMAQIIETAERLAETRKIAVYEDLGIEMAPNSTLCTYLNILLFVLPGAFDVEGGMHLSSGLAGATGGGKSNSYIDDEGYERDYPVTPVTGARIIAGLMPCNSIPEEIVTDHPDRFRAMYIESANPAHSLADTKRFAEAFEALEFMVVIDVAMTETARYADYVLPGSSQYEKYEATFFPSEFPENFFHLRKPMIEPLADTLPEPEIHARMVEALGVFEAGELDELKQAAEGGLEAFTEAMLPKMADSKIMRYLPYVLYRTLGPALGEAASAAALWGLCQRYAMSQTEGVKAAGYQGEGPALGNDLFSKILHGESGVIISKLSVGDKTQWRKSSGKLQLLVAELNDELDTLKNFDLPKRTPDFPLILSAGERRLYTANTAIRDPKWMKSNNPSSLFVHPEDADDLKLEEGGRAKLVTKRGEALVIVELDDRLQRQTIALPNGLGLLYPNDKGEDEAFGVAPNDLTDLDDRDKFVGTPWHKYVRARLEAV